MVDFVAVHTLFFALLTTRIFLFTVRPPHHLSQKTPRLLVGLLSFVSLQVIFLSKMLYESCILLLKQCTGQRKQEPVSHVLWMPCRWMHGGRTLEDAPMAHWLQPFTTVRSWRSGFSHQPCQGAPCPAGAGFGAAVPVPRRGGGARVPSGCWGRLCCHPGQGPDSPTALPQGDTQGWQGFPGHSYSPGGRAPPAVCAQGEDQLL